jgi:UDPglucose 6-dehydrogenase
VTTEHDGKPNTADGLLRFRDMTPPHRTIVIIGAGYVGLVTAAGLAAPGNLIRLVEKGQRRLNALRTGRIPLHEEGLQAAFDAALGEKRLEILGAPPIETPDLVLVCVGTPIDDDGVSDLTQLRSAMFDVAPMVGSGATLVIRSTLPVGTTQVVVAEAGLPSAQTFTNPEFLRQGTALADFRSPSRAVVGGFPDAEPDRLAGVVEALVPPGVPTLIVGVTEAEIIKNGANAFLALKLSFTNELAGLCERYGADVDVVLGGIGSDPRIGSTYLRASFGFGGSCLPKELRTIAAAGEQVGLPMHVTSAASEANASHQRRFVERVAAAAAGLEGRRVAVLGLAFKAGTDDIRSSPAMNVVRLLAEAGADVVAHDPEASANAALALPGLSLASTPLEALRGADVAVIATEWPVYRTLDWAAARDVMANPVVVDGRRLLDRALMMDLGFDLWTVGSPDPRPVFSERAV